MVFAYSWVPGGLDTDSCNYAAVAKEALRTNSWLNLYDPVYQGVFYYHFPLCIWATAAIFKLIGVSTFAAKLFSMFCALALAAAIFFFGRILKNQWAGFFAGIGFLLTNHVVRLSRQCRMDIPVTFFITMALLAFCLGYERNRRYYLLFGLFTALAILAKDIFGLFALAIVLAFLILRLDWKQALHPWFLSGLILAIAPVLFWIHLDRGVLFNGWYNWNFLHLYKSPNFTVPWYYYIRAIVTKYFYFLPFAVYGGYLAIKQARENKRPIFYILLIWVAIFPLAFSFGRQKLHYFILPIYPAAAVLTALALEKIFSGAVKIKIEQVLKFILIFMSIIMLCLPLKIQSKRFRETTRLAPVADEILKELDEYEFMTYNQDAAALLFYFRQLSRVKIVSDKTALEESLYASGKPRLCYISEDDFSNLSKHVQEKCRVVLRNEDKMIIINRADICLPVRLP